MKKSDLADPYIIGRIHENKVICDRCGQGTTGILISNVLLPKDIEPSTRLIVCKPAFDSHGDETEEALFDWLEVLGIGCGCFAKFHRQIAHILDRQKR
jgi:hypothetical protein